MRAQVQVHFLLASVTEFGAERLGAACAVRMTDASADREA